MHPLDFLTTLRRRKRIAFEIRLKVAGGIKPVPIESRQQPFKWI